MKPGRRAVDRRPVRGRGGAAFLLLVALTAGCDIDPPTEPPGGQPVGVPRLDGLRADRHVMWRGDGFRLAATVEVAGEEAPAALHLYLRSPSSSSQRIVSGGVDPSGRAK